MRFGPTHTHTRHTLGAGPGSSPGTLLFPSFNGLGVFGMFFFYYFLHGNDYDDTPLLYHLLLKLVGSAWDGQDGFMGLGFLRRWRFSVYTHCMNSHM